MERDYYKENIQFVDNNPKLEFKLEKIHDDEYRILADFDIYKIVILKGKKYKYILTEDAIYRCSKEFENTNLKLLKLFKENYYTQIQLGKNQLGELFSVVLPRVKDAIKIDEDIQ